jgi:DNA-binding LytR/AlgR family response regulator
MSVTLQSRDIQMPQLDGLGVLAALAPEQIPVVIFATAHDEHAIRAFEVNALDYLTNYGAQFSTRPILIR